MFELVLTQEQYELTKEFISKNDPSEEEGFKVWQSIKPALEDLYWDTISTIRMTSSFLELARYMVFNDGNWSKKYRDNYFIHFRGDTYITRVARGNSSICAYTSAEQIFEDFGFNIGDFKNWFKSNAEVTRYCWILTQLNTVRSAYHWAKRLQYTLMDLDFVIEAGCSDEEE